MQGRQALHGWDGAHDVAGKQATTLQLPRLNLLMWHCTHHAPNRRVIGEDLNEADGAFDFLIDAH
jgi:hypothetical protein